MRIFLLSVGMLVAAVLNAQKYDYNWINGINRDFQKNFIISFESISPVVYEYNSNLDFKSTSCSISNIHGDSESLVFSNGCTIKFFDQSDFEYVNAGDYFCNIDSVMNIPHGMFGLPIPGSNKVIIFNLYSVFPSPVTYQGLNCMNSKLVYHVIDFDGNNGQGSVIEKDQALLEGCFQYPVACKHADGRDWWILIPDNFQNKFYRWLLTPDSITGPIVQEITNPTIGSDTEFGIVNPAWLEFSPNGEQLMINHPDKVTVLYNFDRCTGELLEKASLPRDNTFNHGACYSPDGNMLYTMDQQGKYLLQYDLLSNDIPASKDTVAIWDGFMESPALTSKFSYMQHGPDGKIYIWAGNTAFMHVIVFPNKKGLNCLVKQRELQLSGLVYYANAYYPNYRLGPIDNSSCDTLGIDNIPMAMYHYDVEDSLAPLALTFTDASYYEPTNWYWTFGDGSSSTELNPVHTFPGPGIYTVCLIASNTYGADTLCREVVVSEVSGLTNLVALPQVAVSPNPATDVLQLRLPARVSGQSPVFVLYGLFGREVLRTALNEFDNTVAVGQLPQGLNCFGGR